VVWKTTRRRRRSRKDERERGRGRGRGRAQEPRIDRKVESKKDINNGKKKGNNSLC
jgi:hypothetical protein